MGNQRKIFVNLAIEDLARSVKFFTALGFAFDPNFTDDNATCMIVSHQAFVMLLRRPFFQKFTKRSICDTGRNTETLLALSCESRAEVDALVDTAVASGGARAMESTDHGFMYSSSFYDPDGHHWEVLWMDPKHLAAMQQEN